MRPFFHSQRLYLTIVTFDTEILKTFIFFLFSEIKAKVFTWKKKLERYIVESCLLETCL